MNTKILQVLVKENHLMTKIETRHLREFEKGVFYEIRVSPPRELQAASTWNHTALATRADNHVKQEMKGPVSMVVPIVSLHSTTRSLPEGIMWLDERRYVPGMCT